MKGGSVIDSPSNDGVPCLCAGAPCLRVVSPFCLRGGPVEWRVWWVCVVPVFGLDHSPFSLFPFPSRVVSPLPFACGGVVVWWCGGGAGGCSSVSLSSPVLFSCLVLLSCITRIVFAVTALLV